MWPRRESANAGTKGATPWILVASALLGWSVDAGALEAPIAGGAVLLVPVVPGFLAGLFVGWITHIFEVGVWKALLGSSVGMVMLSLALFSESAKGLPVSAVGLVMFLAQLAFASGLVIVHRARDRQRSR